MAIFRFINTLGDEVCMEAENLIKFIQDVAFFKDFSEHEKRKLTGDKTSFKQFQKDADIFKEGDPGSSLFVILVGEVSLIKLSEADAGKGRVSLKNGKESVVGELDAGAVFGEISLLTGRKRCVTTRVTSPRAVVMEITEKYMSSLIPSIQTKFHKQLLLELVNDLDDMDTRYLKLQSSMK